MVQISSKSVRIKEIQINVTVHPLLKKKLDELAAQKGWSRSRIMEKILRGYFSGQSNIQSNSTGNAKNT